MRVSGEQLTTVAAGASECLTAGGLWHAERIPAALRDLYSQQLTARIRK